MSGATWAGRRVIADRRRPLPAPPPVVWADLVAPRSDDPRAWLHLLADEVAPRVLARQRPRLLTWSSLWTRHPELMLHFDCAPDGAGTRLHVRVDAPEETPDGAWIGHVRYRSTTCSFMTCD